MSRRYVVIGGGAVGSVLAAQLELAGIRTVLVARGAHLEAIREHGLRVRRPGGDDLVRLAVAAGAAEVRLTQDDVLVLAVKSQDADAALAGWAWRPVLAERCGSVAADLPILTFQNGLAAEDAALRRFSTVYGVTIGIAASYLEPGEVVSPSYPVVGVAWLGLHPAAKRDADPLQASLVGDLRAAGFHVEPVNDIATWKARKLLANVNNGLDVLDGSDAERVEARLALVAETRRVLDAAGVLPATDTGLGGGTLIVESVPGHTPGRLSTWQSFARGASSEVDHLNGEVVLIARRHGLDAPLNERLQRLLGRQAVEGAPPGAHTLHDLLAAHRRTELERTAS
ncbi:ketopantoate reductase family protein [Agromyces albus]|uniref:ketopantoate reductase family protein n=1 Tax=Agromyces albus TaxID=205332 RepID=UPI00277EFB5C|nr:2-dehydropantoate 2-reductase N-terminal domain-containing protein [Agromyces albus]MDQ0574228.1 2-dehydropantoate 2-reductase [Agromyces albus]